MRRFLAPVRRPASVRMTISLLEYSSKPTPMWEYDNPSSSDSRIVESISSGLREEMTAREKSLRKSKQRANSDSALPRDLSTTSSADGCDALFWPSQYLVKFLFNSSGSAIRSQG